MSGPSEPEQRVKRRVFFALWPDDATRAGLVRATRSIVRHSGGKPTPGDKLHITLAFLGGLDESELELARNAPRVEVGAFELMLDTLGFKQRSRLLWLTCKTVPQTLTRLEQQLWHGLAQRGFEREARIYRPHVTLARRAQRVDDAVSPVQWPVRELALVESVPAERGTRYEVLQRWPLVGTG